MASRPESLVGDERYKTPAWRLLYGGTIAAPQTNPTLATTGIVGKMRDDATLGFKGILKAFTSEELEESDDTFPCVEVVPVMVEGATRGVGSSPEIIELMEVTWKFKARQESLLVDHFDVQYFIHKTMAMIRDAADQSNASQSGFGLADGFVDHFVYPVRASGVPQQDSADGAVWVFARVTARIAVRTPT